MIIFKSYRVNGSRLVVWILALIAVIFGLYFGLR